MTYDNRRRDFAREPIRIVQLDLEYCDNTFGVAPCTATGSGDAKCYNCRETCQDLPNFAATTKTYSFYDQRSPHPAGLNDAYPYLVSVSTSPAKIGLDGGLGVRSNLTATLTDRPSSDLNIDPYVDQRSYDPLTRGTFFTKLRARNPNYKNFGLTMLSGYLVNGAFDINNFAARLFVIDTLDASNGRCSIKAKDPLTLAMPKKFQVPLPSVPKLSAAMDASQTNISLSLPAGDTLNDHYPASGFISIDKEIMSYTHNGTTMTVVRAQKNTVGKSHSQDATAQLCYSTQGTVSDIAYDMLVNYAFLDPALINKTSWDGEVDNFLEGLLTGFIPKPEDGNKLLKELAMAKPHYLWWDEYAALINLTALKAPPSTANTYNMDSHLLGGATSTKDRTDLRYSTVVVNFGQINPIEKVDEPGNYEQTYTRVDVDSLAKYGDQSIKTINCRWLNVNQSGDARALATLLGKRWANVPREITFKLDPKDGDVWIGQSIAINYRDVVDFSGSPVDTIYQLLSSQENKDDFSYTGIEFAYSDYDDDGDVTPDNPPIIINTDQNNINLRTIWDGQRPTPDASTVPKFEIEAGTLIGEGTRNPANYALDTGNWPVGMGPVFLTVKHHILGAGGDAAYTNLGSVATPGTNGIIMNHELTLDNQGIIAGGGGGGEMDYRDVDNGSESYVALASGGAGAGYPNGVSGASQKRESGDTAVAGESGTNLTAGAGGYVLARTHPDLYGGNGGELGQAGGDGAFYEDDGNTINQGTLTGASGGVAINTNGNTINYTQAGDIRGQVI